MYILLILLYFKAPDDNQYNSQVYDQPTNNSGYPTYSNPYSHDISALTNAHRNQVDNSQNFDSNSNRGGDTYRKYNDDSSGYKSMPSPKKLSESPPRNYHGDNSMARKLNQGSSNYSSQNISHSPRHQDMHKSSQSPTHFQDGRHQDQSSSLSPEHKTRRDPSDDSSPDRGKTYSDDRRKMNGPSRNWADEVDAGPSEYEQQTGEREMMSATPNAAPARHDLAENGVYPANQEDRFNEGVEGFVVYCTLMM